MSTAALLWRQYRFERRLFWRNPSAAFFNFLLPLLMLVLIASVFASEPDELDVLIPGIAGMSIMATTFTSLSFNLVWLREEGVLRRIRSTPMPLPAYFGGMLLHAVTNALLQVTLVIVIGNVFYDVPWPRDWLALAVFAALGIACFAALGVAFAHAIPNVDSAPAYTNAVFLPLIFISGVFYSSDSLPAVLRAIAEALPLKHVIDGLAGAIVDGAGVADHLTALAVICGWLVAGAVVAVRYFRWE